MVLPRNCALVGRGIPHNLHRLFAKLILPLCRGGGGGGGGEKIDSA